jgi:hypothetical protein
MPSIHFPASSIPDTVAKCGERTAWRPVPDRGGCVSGGRAHLINPKTEKILGPGKKQGSLFVYESTDQRPRGKRRSDFFSVNLNADAAVVSEVACRISHRAPRAPTFLPTGVLSATRPDANCHPCDERAVAKAIDRRRLGDPKTKVLCRISNKQKQSDASHFQVPPVSKFQKVRMSCAQNSHKQIKRLHDVICCKEYVT